MFFDFFSLNLQLVVAFSIAVFAILNPFSTIPYYMLLHPEATKKDVKNDTKIIALASFLILMFSAIAWEYILAFFWLEIEYFKISGWILLIIMSIAMMQWQISKIKYDWSEEEQTMIDRYRKRWLIVPLAMPITSWPWSIAYVIWHSIAQNFIELTLWIFIACSFVYIILRSWIEIKTFLWELWIKLITRFIWIILLSLWIQMLIKNLILVIRLNFPWF